MIRSSRYVLVLAVLLGPAPALAQVADLLSPLPPDSCGPNDERVEVLLLGSFHMSNPGRDLYNVRADDVLDPARQRQIVEVVDGLAKFRPTVVAIERQWGDTSSPGRYRAFRAGEHELSRSEAEQIGFRLADRMDLATVVPIDVEGEFPFEPVRELATSDSTLTPYLEGLQAFGKAAVDAITRWQAEGTIGEALYRLNTAEAMDRSHAGYLRYFLPIVKGDDSAGADLLAAWYARNIRIFSNLHRIDLAPDDRVFVVYGAGHVPILARLVEDSPYFCLADPLRYLPAPE